MFLLNLLQFNATFIHGAMLFKRINKWLNQQDVFLSLAENGLIARRTFSTSIKTKGFCVSSVNLGLFFQILLPSWCLKLCFAQWYLLLILRHLLNVFDLLLLGYVCFGLSVKWMPVKFMIIIVRQVVNGIVHEVILDKQLYLRKFDAFMKENVIFINKLVFFFNLK